MKKIFACILLSCLSLCSGCFQASDDDAILRTVPVTNNPYIVPNHGNGLPGGSSAGPY